MATQSVAAWRAACWYLSIDAFGAFEEAETISSPMALLGIYTVAAFSIRLIVVRLLTLLRWRTTCIHVDV